MGGGGRSAPAGPSPAEVAQAQIEAQRKEQERQRKEYGRLADTFLDDNQVTSDWRSGIFGQSDQVAQSQIGLLNEQLQNSFKDIRQRQAGRGQASSAGRFGLSGEASALANSSRAGILDQAQNRAWQRINDQQRFLDSAAASIRGGTSVETARTRYEADLNSANTAFEKLLTAAQSGDQRNAAFKKFELDRGAAASRLSDALSSLDQDALQASAGTFGQTKEDERNKQGQALFNNPIG